MTEETLKVYKYKMDEETFHYLLTSNETQFEDIKSILGPKGQGIKRYNNQLEFYDTQFERNIGIRGVKSVNYSILTFKNIKTDGIYILGADLDNEGRKTNISFENCDIGGFHIQNSIVGEIKFSNCTIDEIKIRKCESKDFCITNCSVKKDSYFIDINTKDFHISKNIFEKTLEFSDSVASFLNFREVVIGDLWIYGLTINRIDINNCTTDAINLYSSKIDSVTLNDSLTGDIKIINSQIVRHYAKSLYCSLLISSSTISQLLLTDCNIPVLEFEKICDFQAYITNANIWNLHFSHTNLKKESWMSISQSNIYFLQMEEVSILGNLYFRQFQKIIKNEWLDFDKHIKILDAKAPIHSKMIEQIGRQHSSKRNNYENSLEEIKKLIKQPTIRFFRSSLGRTEFTDCPLADYLIEFNNSKITDCFVSGSSIPTNNVHIIGAKQNSIEEYQQKASFFNQFKKIFEAQGDIYHATQFQAKWAEEQRKLLELIHKGEKEKFSTTFSDLWILKLNKWSNLHGESWPRAFAFVCGFALFFYLLYLVSIGRLFNGNSFDPNLIGYYFEYLNPAHKLNFIEDNQKINGWTVAIDFFGRIFVAYGIYQFIAAFRKHTKKQ